MPDPLDILTIQEARQAVGLDALDTSHDAELGGWVTAISRRLDRAVGPIVRRTVTGELQDGGGSCVFLNFWPIASVTSVSEFVGTAETTLTLESNASKPANGYLLEQYEPDPTLFGRTVNRRSSNTGARFAAGAQNIKITYVAGRSVAASVDLRFKSAAKIMLKNLWRSDEPSVDEEGEFTVPRQAFPTFAVPNAAMQMLSDFWQELGGFA